ncbi:MAG: hypothetical protein HN948_10275, partial [Clostridia bacterium]|nr:hypothetical protein [Clostridia bacterium]
QNENQPGAVVTAVPIFTTLKAAVNIPDPNLKALLRDAAGMQSGQIMYKEDMKYVSGILDFSGQNIENLEGLQHCKNIERLNLNDNNISSMVDMNGMTNLEFISFDGNSFTKLPSEFYYSPKLHTLSMRNNPITSVSDAYYMSGSLISIDLTGCELTAFPPEFTYHQLKELFLSGNPIGALSQYMTSLSGLEILHADNCGLTELPESLYEMDNLRELSLAGNNISSLSASIKKLTKLEALNLLNNKLTELPNEIQSMQSLKYLILDNNRLTSLPMQIANAPLEYLSARNNAIAIFPYTLCQSTKIQTIDLMLNNITELPYIFDQSNFSYISLTFNRLDITPGSATRSQLDSLGGTTVKYEPQLTAPTGLKTDAAHDSVTISWDACPTGMYSTGALHVDSYKVYLGNTLLEELPSSAQSYTHSGLSPETNYDYTIAVRYWIEHGPHNVNEYRSLSTSISATTLKEPLPTPEPGASAEVASAVPSETTDTAPSETAQSTTGSDETEASPGAEAAELPPTFPIWAIIVICVVGAAILSIGGFFGWRTYKKRKKKAKSGINNQ